MLYLSVFGKIHVKCNVKLENKRGYASHVIIVRQTRALFLPKCISVNEKAIKTHLPVKWMSKWIEITHNSPKEKQREAREKTN